MKRPARFHVRWPDHRQAEIELHPHPTDSLIRCDNCGDSCAGDAKAMADFIADHTARHTGESA